MKRIRSFMVGALLTGLAAAGGFFFLATRPFLARADLYKDPGNQKCLLLDATNKSLRSATVTVSVTAKSNADRRALTEAIQGVQGVTVQRNWYRMTATMRKTLAPVHGAIDGATLLCSTRRPLHGSAQVKLNTKVVETLKF